MNMLKSMQKKMDALLEKNEVMMRRVADIERENRLLNTRLIEMERRLNGVETKIFAMDIEGRRDMREMGSEIERKGAKFKKSFKRVKDNRIDFERDISNVKSDLTYDMSEIASDLAYHWSLVKNQSWENPAPHVPVMYWTSNGFTEAEAEVMRLFIKTIRKETGYMRLEGAPDGKIKLHVPEANMMIPHNNILLPHWEGVYDVQVHSYLCLN